MGRVGLGKLEEQRQVEKKQGEDESMREEGKVKERRVVREKKYERTRQKIEKGNIRRSAWGDRGTW